MTHLRSLLGLVVGGLVVLRVASTQTAYELTGDAPPAGAIWLDSLDVTQAHQDYGEPHAGQTVDNHPIALKGEVYKHGLGTHSVGRFTVDLHRAAARFVSMVGIADETNGRGSVTFEVEVDGKSVARTGVIRGGDAPQRIDVDLTGARRMVLKVGDAGDGYFFDHAVWAGAYIALAPGASARPEAFRVAAAPPRLVVPPPDLRPAIHGARIAGATPGRPFLFLIPATGLGPLVYSATHLPAGLRLDGRTGIISGTLKGAGTTVVTMRVRGPQGTAARMLTIVGGDHKLALTPPMGWNSWNVWGTTVTEDKIKAAADEMATTGLAAHGFQYVNIDESWDLGTRDAQGEIRPNPTFHDMRALTDFVHSKGLKIGIYSSPGPKTCDGDYSGSYQHEEQDARTFAGWGFDYLKYDWCTYGNIAKDGSLPELQKPYRVMRAALDGVDRDIVFSLCQYGMGDVWQWGAQVGGNCWRTHGDIQDNWNSLHDIYEKEAGHERYAGPGHWNDPDMLMVGIVGFGNTHPTHLTPNEQILHITMWCMVSSPLLIGCDMTRLDPFTLALLSNDEALDVNQDPLGKPASRVAQSGDLDVWARPLFDGTTAVALVNGGDDPAVVTARWKDLALTGRRTVRDLWLHKNVGIFDGSYGVDVPAHGAVMVKVGRR